jgi:hypothetical protein
VPSRKRQPPFFTEKGTGAAGASHPARPIVAVRRRGGARGDFIGVTVKSAQEIRRFLACRA